MKITSLFQSPRKMGILRGVPLTPLRTLCVQSAPPEAQNRPTILFKFVFVDLFEASHQRPPCVKGAGICAANDWGIDGKMF